ncbi:hypothetical protein RQP46_002216 [Phenoliferia psychrophenolica]
MSASIPTQFTGYGAKDLAEGKRLDLEPISYTPKVWSENDVDIKISHCGICGSDLHTISNGWAPVGTIVRAGAKSGHAIGTRVGVGAQYQGKWEDGSISQGGYADFVRCQGRFAIPIPDNISSAEAAPLLPLERFGCGPGKKVGVVGIGGLGHLALQWAAAMGAETFALSHSTSKVADAAKLGVKAESFIVAKDAAATAIKYAKTLDILILTSSHIGPLEELYFPLLRHEGTLVLLGVPEEKLPRFYGQSLIVKNLSVHGSFIGSTAEIKDMFALAAKTGNGLARYRFVLEN